ncbi:MAG: hypothetical protein Q4D68_04730 [Moraxella equi]|nr:hypothetical protein [Moraxella equi]
MISYGNADLHERIAHLQKLANKHPVLIQDGDTKQVLLDYEHYKELVGDDADRPFLSAYDAFVAMMSDFSEEGLTLLTKDDVVFDMSHLEK